MLLVIFFTFLCRQKLKMKERKEAWLKIDDLAKQNPTFDEIATTLNNCDDPFLFSSLFLDPYNNNNMIDDEDLLLGDDDLLPITSSDKSYTQVCLCFFFFQMN